MDNGAPVLVSTGSHTTTKAERGLHSQRTCSAHSNTNIQIKRTENWVGYNLQGPHSRKRCLSVGRCQTVTMSVSCSPFPTSPDHDLSGRRFSSLGLEAQSLGRVFVAAGCLVMPDLQAAAILLQHISGCALPTDYCWQS